MEHYIFSLNSSFFDELINGSRRTTKYNQYLAEKRIYNPNDYVSTSTFLIKVNQYFPNSQNKIYFKEYDTYLDDFNNPTKEMVKNFATILVEKSVIISLEALFLFCDRGRRDNVAFLLDFLLKNKSGLHLPAWKF